MARTERLFRVRISTRGASSMSGNVDLTFTDPDIFKMPKEWGGQRIKPLEGRTRVSGFTVSIIDESDQVTSNLSEDFSTFSTTRSADILARLIDISSSVDGGTSWSVEATGILDEVSQKRDNPAVYDFNATDELSKLKSKRVFVETKKIGSGNTPEATTSLFPGGVWGGWSTVDAVDPLVSDVNEVSGDRVTLKARTGETGTGRRSNIPEPNRQAISDDLKPSVEKFTESDVPDTGSGHFEHLRFWVESINGNTGAAGAQTSYEVYAQKSLINKDGRVGKQVKENDTQTRTLDKLSLNWSINQPSTSDTVEGILYLPNVDPSERVPLHFGDEAIRTADGLKPENGFHPVDWAKKVFDLIGANYNATQLATKKKQRLEIPKLWPRITSTENAWDHLREHVFKPFGFQPVVNKSGEIELKDVLMPVEDEVPDVNALTNLDESSLSMPPPDIRIRAADQVTKVTTTLLRFNIDLSEAGEQNAWKFGDPGPDSADMQRFGEEKTETYTRHVDEVGEEELELDYSFLSFSGAVQEEGRASVGKTVAEDYLDRYSQGGVITEVRGMEAVRDVSPGEYIILDVGSYPNLRDQARGGTRLMQVTSRAFRTVGVDLVLLDAGPDEQPLPAPSISASAVSAFQIDVTVGGSGGTGTTLEGGRVVVEAAQNSTEPAIDSDKWAPAGERTSQGTVSVHGLAPNMTYWFRARQFAEDRITSTWSSAISATTSTITAPSNLSVDEGLGCAVRISWTNGSDSIPTQILVDDVVQPPKEPPGATERFITGLSPSTSITIKVRHAGAKGGTSSAVNITHTTAPASTGPRMGAFGILVGETV